MNRLLIACVVFLLALCHVAAQELETPWKDWQPPEVTMPSPNAFDLYQEAFDRIEQFGEVYPEADPDELHKALEDHALTFRLLQEAMMGECRLPVVTDFAQQFPYLAKFRAAARMFAARSTVYLEEGKGAEAALDCIACVRLGADAATNRTLIGGMVSVACEAIGLKYLDTVIPQLQPEECRAAIAALRAAMAERLPLSEMLEGEAIAAKIEMRRQFSQATSGMVEQILKQQLEQDEIEEALKEWSPAKSWHAYDELFQAMIEQARKPYWDRAELTVPDDRLVKILAPVFTRTHFRYALADAKLRLALVHLAAQGYMLAEGIPPTDLKVLVPDYLPTIPDDPFADGPIRLTVKGDDFVTYSVGPDGVDDGGSSIEGFPEPDSTGDIVILL